MNRKLRWLFAAALTVTGITGEEALEAAYQWVWEQQEENMPVLSFRICQWTDEEDDLLTAVIENDFDGQIPRHGRPRERDPHFCWDDIAERCRLYAPWFSRSGQQCYNRWTRRIAPQWSREEWTSEEERILLERQAQYGNRWSLIAQSLPGRSPAQTEAHWHVLERRLYRGSQSNTEAQNQPPAPSALPAPQPSAPDPLFFISIETLLNHH